MWNVVCKNDSSELFIVAYKTSRWLNCSTKYHKHMFTAFFTGLQHLEVRYTYLGDYSEAKASVPGASNKLGEWLSTQFFSLV